MYENMVEFGWAHQEDIPKGSDMAVFMHRDIYSVRRTGKCNVT